jgi:hypothetical protein
MEMRGSRIPAVKFSLPLLLALLLTMATGRPGWAQFTTAQLNGAVVDASGLALVGARIEVEQVDTGGPS